MTDKMKKFVFFAVAALAFAGCAKEVQAPEADNAVSTYPVRITAGIETTKTAYDASGKFSWVAGDKIGVLVTDGTTTKQVAFTAASSGPSVEFTGEVETGFELAGQASYPFTGVKVGYATDDLLWDAEKKGWTLNGSIKPGVENPLASIPLLGVKDQNGTDYYSFQTAVGVLKFTVENVPVETAYAYMEVPDASGAVLNGCFSLDGDGYLKMSNAIASYRDRYNWNVPEMANETIDYYFFLPVGKLPAGTKFELCNSNWEAIESKVFTKEVEVVRNAVTSVATISLEPVTAYTLEDILGTYDMEVTGGDYSSNAAPGDLVLEASDDASKGNVMLTKFGGVAGKQYGRFNGVTITFPKDQIFGANPFSDATDKPYVALDFYKGSVVDAQFEVQAAGKIAAVNADAMGLRSCTTEDWQTYGGGWPWALCYGSLTATFTQKVLLSADMITAASAITWDGGGVPALVDGFINSYWHSDYYYPVTGNDSVYGLYFDIALNEALQNFHFEYIVRQGNAGSRPTRVLVAVSEDGTNWTQKGDFATTAMSEAAAGARVVLPGIDAGAAYKYIRFGIIDSADPSEGSLTGDLNFTGYKKCANLAELMLYPD